MLHANGKRTCDYEVGRPGAWHACNNPAAYGVHSNFGHSHACARHVAKASSPIGKVPSWRLFNVTHGRV